MKMLACVAPAGAGARRARSPAREGRAGYGSRGWTPSGRPSPEWRQPRSSPGAGLLGTTAPLQRMSSSSELSDYQDEEQELRVASELTLDMKLAGKLKEVTSLPGMPAMRRSPGAKEESVTVAETRNLETRILEASETE